MRAMTGTKALRCDIILFFAAVAQSVEQLLRKQKVASSIPASSTKHPDGLTHSASSRFHLEEWKHAHDSH